MNHVTVTSAQSSIDQVGSTTLTAVAVDTSGADQTRNATFAWSASPVTAVKRTPSAVNYTITITGIEAGTVTVTATATWKGVAKAGSSVLTIRAIHFQLTPSVSAPLVGQPFLITARALYANSTIDVNYAGTVNFTSDDPAATLPATTTFTPGSGIYVFANVIVQKTGAVHISMVDTVAPTVSGTATVTGNRAPVARISVSYLASDPRHIAVDGSQSSDPDGDVLTYAWAFGDGGVGTGPTATHVYPNSLQQSYVIQLDVSDPYGAVGTITHAYTAYVPPAVDFEVKQMNASGAQIYVRLNATGSASWNLAGVIVAYNWTWGDGSWSNITANETYHIYAASYNNAQVNLGLTVGDNYSLWSSVTKQVLITTAAVPPVADFTLTIDNKTRTVTVDGSGSRSPIGRTIVAYNWTWGDLAWSGNQTSPTASHAYATDGTFTIVLQVWDSGTPSLSGSKSGTAQILQPALPPDVFFNATRTLMHVVVDASATTDPNNNIASYTWSWGDGSAPETHATPTASHDYATPNAYRIVLTVTDTTSLTNSTSHYVSAARSTLDYRYYDFFNVPYGQWWDYRTSIGGYGDEPVDTNCFNATSATVSVSGAPLCNPTANPALPTAETYPYTNWYPLPGNIRYNNPGNDPLIYAPYRFNATGVDVGGYNLSEPVFLPVRNYAAPIGKELQFNWYLQYLDNAADQSLRGQGCSVWDSSLASSGFDGFILWNRINITTDLAESQRIFGIPLNYTASNAQSWWNTNTRAGYANYGALETWLGVNTGAKPADGGWFASEGNGKYDVYSSFQYPYTPFCTEVVGKVDPSTGTTQVYISHVGYATEVLLARWFYWGNASYRLHYLDSTKARGWWGMELAWFEDMHFVGGLDANDLNFTLDTAMQYHFAMGSLPGKDGKYRTQVGESVPPDDVPYWSWWPILTDYISPNNHPTELARYTSVGWNYIHSTPGAGNYAQNVSFDYVPITWNLKAGQTWDFAFPTGNAIFYDPNTSPIPANPQGQLNKVIAPLQYNFTFPSSLGGIAFWNQTTNSWSVFGPTNTGGPDSSGPGKYPLVWPYPAIFFTPDPPAGAAAVAFPRGLAVGGGPSVLGLSSVLNPIRDWASTTVAVIVSVQGSGFESRD